MHNSGKGAKYTQSRLPVKLVYAETHSTKSKAMQREYEIKQLKRKQKLELIHKKLESENGNRYIYGEEE